ncbi:hypothetical protein F5B20DRAFT_577058 [Whalleya microplaca]|nr:hypothetical protein F5B20DRAFT_577058 [Whalleya microplaca]
MPAIADHVAFCLESFNSITLDAAPDGFNQVAVSKLADESARFKIWAGNIGAHKRRKNSLDYRLRDASHLQKQVRTLLIDLRNSLESARATLNGERIPWDEFSSDDEDEDQNKPADGYEFETELDQICADVAEAVDCLLRLSMSIRSPAAHDRLKASNSINTSHYEAFDISHIRAKFKSANSKLAEHLGEANSRRRQFFKYRESQHAKLCEGLNADTSKSVAGQQSTVISSMPQYLKDSLPDLKLGQIDEDEKSESGITQSSYATTHGDTNRLHVPTLPAEASKGPFEWSDFERRHQWINHMLEKHWRLWHCAFCIHPPFNSYKCLQDHLEDSHLNTANNDQMKACMELCTSQRSLNSTRNCPFCQELMHSTGEYKRHVGHHLEEIALFVLPRNFRDDNGDEALSEHSLRNVADDSITRSSHSANTAEEDAVRLEEALEKEREETNTRSAVSRHSSQDPITAESGSAISSTLPRTTPYPTGYHVETTESLDGYDAYRQVRIAEILSDFRTLQYYVAAAPVDPLDSEDYYTEGWAVLRQCALDGRYILNLPADMTAPNGKDTEAKAELKQVILDSYSRRHEAQKIYLRQAAAQRWIESREQILKGQRPTSSHRRQLRTCDEQLHNELAQITDEAVYQRLQGSDVSMSRWTGEDPSLRAVQRWVRDKPQTT